MRNTKFFLSIAESNSCAIVGSSSILSLALHRATRRGILLLQVKKCSQRKWEVVWGQLERKLPPERTG